MKVAVSARGSTPDSDIDERMGRAYWLMIYETKTNSWQAINNDSGRNALEGAGKKTASLLIDLGITAVLTGEIGPRAFRLLHEAGIEVYLGAAGTVMDTLVLWHDGNLNKAKSANNIGSPYCITGSGSA
ncbi:MAG: dinitrogenase iron-molybdenum cofactor biosynthesis protein [Desulfuromonas sp.]|mgnify:CR=1 FL=1|nr:MAG: dinitrogenase iron-molybdenum cofactor biosynthesis protein [Desulfuromonas sp.]